MHALRRMLAALMIAVPAAVSPSTGHADEALVDRALDRHILPAYARLAEAAATLKTPAANCDAAALRTAYHATFDAWMGAQHIAFGPVEQGDRRFAIAFWPDTKGFTRKALDRLIKAKDPIVSDPEGFARLSVAARGLFALERLLFEPPGIEGPDNAYRCALAGAITHALAETTAAVLDGWADSGGAVALRADDPKHAASELFRSVDGGLEALSALRIGRPLGTPERVWPRRAEAWRSGRSARNIQLGLAAAQGLYEDVFAPLVAPETHADLLSKFERTRTVAGRIPEDFSVIETDLQARLRLEAAQMRIRDLQQALRAALSEALDVPVGFNALDGD